MLPRCTSLIRPTCIFMCCVLCSHCYSTLLSTHIHLYHRGNSQIQTQGTDIREHYRPTVSKFWSPAFTGSASDMCPVLSSSSASSDDPAVQRANSNNVYVTEMSTRRKNFDDNAVATGNIDDDKNDAEVESMSLSRSGRLFTTMSMLLPMSMWPLWRHVNVLVVIT